MSEFPITKSSEGISDITTKLGIRESYLEKFSDSWEIRIGDRFQLTRMTDGSGVLKRIRGNTQKTLPLSKESIYQDIEKWPDSFPQITFTRLLNSHEYRITGKNGVELPDTPMIVSAANLDVLKKEIDTVSWVFVTECSARSAIASLSCDIKESTGRKDSIILQSKDWYDFFSSTVGLTSIQKLLKSHPSPSEIAWILAQSFNPMQIPPNSSKIAWK